MRKRQATETVKRPACSVTCSSHAVYAEALPWVLSAYTAHRSAVQVLSRWQNELEEARLAREGTLCRDSMPARERAWLRTNRPEAAVHWSLLTSLTAEQLPYAAI
jgi:hypothetical protein